MVKVYNQLIEKAILHRKPRFYYLPQAEDNSNLSNNTITSRNSVWKKKQKQSFYSTKSVEE